MSKLYEVAFETKNGGYAHWIIHIEESNLNAAKKKACCMWQEANKTAHMFHVRCRKLKKTMKNSCITGLQELTRYK